MASLLREPAVLLGAGVLVALVPGLWRERSPLLLRLVTLVVAGLFLASAIGPARDMEERVQPRLRVVADGPVPAAMRAGLTARLGDTVDIVEASPDAGELAVALHGTGAQGADTPALMWVQPIGGGGVPAATPASALLLAALPRLDFEPTDVHLRQLGSAHVGRPMALVLSGLPAAWQGEATITAPGDDVLAQASLAPMLDARIESLPVTAGKHRVALVARGGEHAFTAGGEVEVTPPPPLLALGAGAEPLAAALRAQGFAVESVAALPDDLARCQGIVVARVLTADEQQRLLTYVDDGGGVLLVGTADGGGLPISGEPAASLSPVVLVARPPATQPGTEGTGSEAAPSAPPPTAKAPPPPDAPATGDTAGAQPPSRDEREVERRSVAMVFVLDRSGSMLQVADRDRGLRRIDYVVNSAKATASRLLPGDTLAIVTFGNKDAEKVELPLTSATALEAVHDAFRRVEAHENEGTYVASALACAGEMLRGARAAVKHVVVITDGVFASEDQLPASESVRGLRADGVSTSLIRFGSEGVDEPRYGRWCRDLTSFGGGKYFHSNTTTELPALVSSEVKRVLAKTGRRVPEDDEARALDSPAPAPAPDPPTAKVTAPSPPVAEPPIPEPTPPAPASRLSVRVIEDSPLLAPTLAAAPPDLSGILPVTARADARVLLVAGDEGRPLLAFKSYGLGRVAAWTADLGGAWSTAWRAAADFPGWLAQWVSALAPATVAGDAADVLTARSVAPRGPTPAEVAALERYCGQALQDWQQLQPAPPVTVKARQSLGPLFALAGALGVLLLAGIEFLLARRVARLA